MLFCESRCDGRKPTAARWHALAIVSGWYGSLAVKYVAPRRAPACVQRAVRTRGAAPLHVSIKKVQGQHCFEFMAKEGAGRVIALW